MSNDTWLGEGGRIPPAVRAAGVAAASSAAVVAVRHALARNSTQETKREKSDDPLAGALDVVWGAARDALRPVLEDTAAAAGRYAGENIPDALLEMVVPRFVEGFHEARERREADADEAALSGDDSDGGDEDE